MSRLTAFENHLSTRDSRTAFPAVPPAMRSGSDHHLYFLFFEETIFFTPFLFTPIAFFFPFLQ